MFAAADTVTVDDLIAQVRAAIELGEITQQHAPGGHPIFQAVADARELEGWLIDNAGLMGSGPGANVQRKVQETVSAIYDAAAGVRNDPEAPPPATIWPRLSTPSLSWPWVGAAAGGLLLVAILFQQQRGRRR